MKPGLQILDVEFCVHWLAPGTEIPASALESEFCWTARTPDEVSLVCPEHIEVAAEKSETGWKCIKVRGPLEFELTGILAGLSGTLANAGISIFAISTFETDYLLVKATDLNATRKTITDNDYVFITGLE